MRMLMVAAAMVALGAATAADAGERVVVRGPAGGGMKPGGWQRPATRPAPVTPRPGGWKRPGGWQRPGHPGGWNRPGGHVRPRWGGHVQGRWWGGWRAPGGWGAYRRPIRGFVLPGYWISPNWFINDWAGYGLPQPPYGYNWSRYYDDAVLIDGRGSVYDTIGGVDWDSVDPDGVDYAYDDAAGYDGYAYGNGGAPGAPYAYPERRDDGLGGAAIGAVAGGVAGNVIAGRGNRLGGTLVGAGVGAAAGYAIDKAEDRGRRPPPPPPPSGYGAGYPPPPPPGHGAGASVVTTNSYAGAGYPAAGYYADGYYYPGPTLTTVTVQSQPVVTTTTTETWDDGVTYTRPAVKKVWRKRTWRAKPKCVCR